MKKILLILMLFTPIITWGQKSDLIKFLDACKTFEFEESKEIISKYSFNLGNMYDLLNYEEPTGILFDTDTLNIKGYKAIINCKIKNKAGQYIDKKMIVVMYLNKENSLWCVEMFREATDPNKEYTVSLNLDDDDQLLVQNMNGNDDAEDTAELLKDLFPDFSYVKRKRKPKKE